ncbi:MAG: hypothetical protein RLZZ299_2452 [Pseudomonadota bacterium]
MTTLLLLAACGGLNDETTLTELRVVAMIAEPPEVGPGQATTVTSHIVDPADAGFEVLTWTCTDLGDGCLEPDLGLAWYAAGDPAEDGSFSATFRAPALAGVPSGGGPPFRRPAPRAAPRWVPPWVVALWQAAAAWIPLPAPAPGADSGWKADTGDGDTGGPPGGWDPDGLPDAVPLVATYTLACTPGTCPAIAAARAGTLAPADVADVTALMRDLPIAGTSLATRRIWLGSGVAGHENPVLTLAEAPAVGSEVALRFTVSGALAEDSYAYGYAEGGGFDQTRYRVENGEVTLTWVPPEGGGTGEAWVVLNDGLGGSALWRGTLEGTAAPAAAR